MNKESLKGMCALYLMPHEILKPKERKNPKPDESKMVTPSFPFPGMLIDPYCFQFLAVYILLQLCNSTGDGGILADEMGFGKVSDRVFVRQRLKPFDRSNFQH